MTGFDPVTSLLWSDNHPQIGPLRVEEVEDGVKRSSTELHQHVCMYVYMYVCLCAAFYVQLDSHIVDM